MGAITDNCDNFVEPTIEEEEEEEPVFNENEINGKFKMVSMIAVVFVLSLITSDPNVKGERVEAESERSREPRVWGFGKHD